MILNVTYNNPEVDRKINAEVGKAFGILHGLTSGGIGSPQLHIKSASCEIAEKLMLDNNKNVCNIELRPNGIIIRFRSLLETFGWVIPFHKLTIFKSQDTYSIHHGNCVMKIAATDPSVTKFIRRVQSLKAVYSSENQMPDKMVS